MRSDGERLKPCDSLNDEACDGERACPGRRKFDGVRGSEVVEAFDIGDSSGTS